MDLTIGSLIDSDHDAPAALRAERFNRHTFWCGQSGSGKTYALGVVLEQLLIHTELPMVILDPNADFVRLGETRPGATGGGEIDAADIRVLRSTDGEGESLRERYIDMEPRSKAAVLQLDPIRDAAEFNAFLRLEQEFGPQNLAAIVEALRATDDPAQRLLGMRIENLGVLEWDLWAWGASGTADLVDRRPRVTVLDLGGFRVPVEPKVAALAVLDRLWATREQRRPVLIVIDEAHNICPAAPATPVERALTERVVQIAAEGRKYGLWLLLSTQRPSKIHQNVLSQCDNLALMKMSSPRDLAELGDIFGYAPAELLGASPGFTQGQALFAGGFIGEPSLVRMGERLTYEGGADVQVPL